MRKPRVLTRCVANYHAMKNERIIEFSSDCGGGLIAFRALDDGTLRIIVYNTDETVRVETAV